jgi:hypothetical protein
MTSLSKRQPVSLQVPTLSRPNRTGVLLPCCRSGFSGFRRRKCSRSRVRFPVAPVLPQLLSSNQPCCCWWCAQQAAAGAAAAPTGALAVLPADDRHNTRGCPPPFFSTRPPSDRRWLRLHQCCDVQGGYETCLMRLQLSARRVSAAFAVCWPWLAGSVGCSAASAVSQSLSLSQSPELHPECRNNAHLTLHKI